MRRLLLLAATFAALLAVGAQAPAAQAQIDGFSCPSFSLGTPAWSGGNLQESWVASCSGAMWHADFYAQIEISGAWQDANCVNTMPCHIRKPSSGQFTTGQHSGTVNFDPLGNCTSRYRIHLFLQSVGGTQFGPFSSVASATC